MPAPQCRYILAGVGVGLSSAPEEAARTLSYQAGSLRKGKRLLDKVIESRLLLEYG